MLKKEIDQILEKIRPALARHGGDIEVVDVNTETGVVRVRFKGACVGCPLSQITLKAGVEATLIQEVEGVKEVVAVS